jgi:hypothetical protein
MEETIPEDVRAAADSVWLELASIPATEAAYRAQETIVIARAIMAERARCANLVEDGAAAAFVIFADNPADAARAIATSIRSGV